MVDINKLITALTNRGWNYISSELNISQKSIFLKYYSYIGEFCIIKNYIMRFCILLLINQ